MQINGLVVCLCLILNLKSLETNHLKGEIAEVKLRSALSLILSAGSKGQEADSEIACPCSDNDECPHACVHTHRHTRSGTYVYRKMWGHVASARATINIHHM